MRTWIITGLLCLLALNTGWFVVYSAQLGWRGLTSGTPQMASRVFAQASPLALGAVAVHMVAGGILTIAAPLQALPVLRRRWPSVHRRTGELIFALALVTSLGGLTYILLSGTVGGWWMSVWFAVYGVCIGVAAWQTVRHARARAMRKHFVWATRLIILAVGSWIYRMHYALWYLLTDGVGSRPDFAGLFDQIQVVAFFVPYLLGAEILLRRSKRS